MGDYKAQGTRWSRASLTTLIVLPHDSHHCSGLSLAVDGSVSHWTETSAQVGAQKRHSQNNC